MVIKSSFKDYYDWIGNRYGGGDPRVVYVRGRLMPMPKAGKPDLPLEVETDSMPPVAPNYRYSWFYGGRPDDKRWAYLAVAGKLYLISRPTTDLTDDVSGFTLEPLEEPEEDQKKPHWRSWRPQNIEFGKELPWLVKLSQDVGHPVFVILGAEYSSRSRTGKVVIAPQCPILSEIGLAALVSAEQMYQDLAYFVGNLMHRSPDIQPPVELSNRQKIVKAGFDLVMSFRHRK
jgi:hypothetical protein